MLNNTYLDIVEIFEKLLKEMNNIKIKNLKVTPTRKRGYFKLTGIIWGCSNRYYDYNYQLLAVVLLCDQAKILEPSPPYPNYGHPNEHKVYRVYVYYSMIFIQCYYEILIKT